MSTIVLLAVMLATGVLATREAMAAVVEFDIAAQPLAQALNRWADQAGLQIIWPAGDPRADSISPAVKGNFEPMEALKSLLQGTGLTYSVIGGGRTIAIQQVKQGLRTAALEAESAQRTAQATAPAEAPAKADGTARQVDQVIDEVFVTGTQIRGLENRTAPVTVIDKEQIDATGIGNATQLLESVPQNFAIANQSGVSVPGSNNGPVQGSTVNLRGLGEGATLILLNGRRMALGLDGTAVDISALPLTAIERVEILTDGASALYGSDAVGGVVNFVLRDDFEGAETRLRTGRADGDLNEYRVSQVLGTAWNSGNALLSMEYYKRDLLRASSRDFVPSTSAVRSLLPEDKSYSAVLSAHQGLTDRITAFVDAMYVQRDSYNEAAPNSAADVGTTNTIDNPQIAATLGTTVDLAQDWQLEVSGSYARNDLNLVAGSSLFASPLFGGPRTTDTLFQIRSVQVKADGSVLSLPGGNLRIAVGGEWRKESYEYSLTFPSGLFGLNGDSDQVVRSAFVEAYVPVFGDANAFTAMRHLDLSLAGRFDDYSEFGSAVSPSFGVLWEPLDGLRLRARYGTSYRAPRLKDYNVSSNSATAFTGPDPGSPSGASHQLQVGGINVEGLEAEESRSTSIGLEFSPPAVRGLRFGLNYYDIKYRDRIANPPLATVMLLDPVSYASLLTRDPSVDLVNQFIAIGQQGQGFFAYTPTLTPDINFDPSSIDLIIDRRRRNMSVVSTHGFDASAQYAFDAGENTIRLGLQGTYILDLEQQITSASPEFDTVSTFYNPPDLRLRGSVGWSRANWSINTFVNYTDSYVDNRTLAKTAVDSYTTVDARLAYQFSQTGGGGFLSGMTFSATVQNVFDEDPPSTAVLSPISDMGFDPTNARPLGRFVAVEITKAW
jgi:iron complex outermembrane recepter protein